MKIDKIIIFLLVACSSFPSFASQLFCRFTLNSGEEVWERTYTDQEKYLYPDTRKEEHIMGPFRVIKDFWEERNSWTIVVKKVSLTSHVKEQLIASATLNIDEERSYSPLLLSVNNHDLDIDCLVKFEEPIMQNLLTKKPKKSILKRFFLF